MTRIPSLALTLACAAFVLAAAVPSAAKESRGGPPGHHVLEGPEVWVYNVAGELTVVPGTGPSVEVEVTPGGKDGGRLTVSETREKGVSVLRVLYPENKIVYPDFGYGPPNGVNSNSYLGYGGKRIHVTGRGPGLEAHADIKVLVPRGKHVRLHLAVGRASISEVEGKVHFEGASSSVEADRLAGAFSADVGSGNIRVSRSKAVISADAGSGDIVISEVDGNLSADTGSGNIEIRRVGAQSIAADAGSGSIRGSDIRVTSMSADCGSGEIDLEGTAADRLALDAGSGSIHLRLTRNIDQLAIEAGSGSVRLEAPGDLSARFRIECPKRQLHIDFPTRITHGDDDETVGTIGSGKGRIDIDAGSGRVELVRM